MAKYDKFTSPKNEGRPVQVESAIRDGAGKNIENNYAKQNGSYSTMTVGLAEGIVTERQIEEPELSCPPIVMGTTGGDAEIQTGNNRFESLLGNSKKWNQLFKVRNNATGEHGLTITPSDGGFILNGTQNEQGDTTEYFTLSSVDIPIGGLTPNHKYFVGGISDLRAKATTVHADTALHIPNAGGATSPYSGTLKEDCILTVTAANTAVTRFYLFVHNNDSWSNVKANIIFIDLTLIYGAGNEPTTVADFKKDYGAAYYAYNAGTILSSKTAQLISRCRQQWDEEWKHGYYNQNTGVYADFATYICSKNPIKVIQQTDYYLAQHNINKICYICWYDESGNFLGTSWYSTSQPVRTSPVGADTAQITILDFGAGDYNHNLTLSVFWEDGEGYDQYYPYQAQIVDLPNIELRSAGTAKDEAYAQGGGKRRLGYVDLGTLSWGRVLLENNIHGFVANLSTFKPQVNPDEIAHLICSKYISLTRRQLYTEGKTGISSWSTTSTISIRDPNYEESSEADFKTAMSGVYLVYELLEETDIPESENPGWTELVYTDNYGTLQFITDPQQIPQVEQPYFIKYTISLTEFLDSSYVRTGGDAKNIALQKDIDEIVSGAKQVGHAEFADNLTPYSEESGTDQEEPFVNQGSGTANSTLSDFASTSVAQLQEKRGNSVVVNQLSYNPLPSSIDRYTSNQPSAGTVTFENGVIKYQVTALAEYFYGQGVGYFSANAIPIIKDHKYLCTIEIFASRAMKVNFAGGANDAGYYFNFTSSGTQKRISIFTCSHDENANRYWYLSDFDEDLTAYITLKNNYLIDLTQWFRGNDNIPADIISHPENFFRYYQGSLAYNAGSLLNSNASVLKSIGRQAWDEEWEVGSYSSNTGAKITADKVRSKNFIPVTPGQKYYFYNVDGYGTEVFAYDCDKNFIEYLGGWSGIKTMPKMCAFITIAIATAYGTEYHYDCTISRYYEGEDDYDQYYPYEVLSEINIGNEVLRSCYASPDNTYQKCFDIKYPDGLIKRRIATLTINAENITSSEVGTTGGSGIKYVMTDVVGANTNSDVSTNNGIGSCNRGEFTVRKGDPYWAPNMSVMVRDGTICITNDNFTTVDQFKALCPIQVNYLINEVIEEGTPYSENLRIDDFGSMMFEGEEFNGIPMGNLIFYPSDYKAFVDTLYDYTSGAPSNLVLQSERTADKAAQASTDSALQAAVGGTLRQCLCVKESLDFDNTAFVDLGTLNWQYFEVGHVQFQATELANIIKKPTTSSTVPNALSTLYVVLSPADYNTNRDKINLTINEITGYINIHNANYTNATTFKNAMKGVLLAYEKAA